ncbi:MAG: nucleoside hydrolase [Candidatus Hydrogenedentes bacterium]|nr:nucleoside hydrolase [Candidatus Hydrogenedentota bacterium]
MCHLLLAPILVLTAAAAPVPVILDTDLGDDIDDTWALAFLLGTPQVDVKLIVTATSDTERKTRLVAKILEQMGRTDIPIGTGVRENDEKTHQDAWLGKYTLDEYKGVVHADGVGAMIDAIKASPTPITLCVIGPQTNIKAALERDPSIAQKARVVSMAGSVYVGYDGKATPDPEYNVVRDVKAAQAVFAAPWEITYAPLDSCGALRIRGDRYARVCASKNPLAVTTIENYNLWANRSHHPQDSSSILFDTVAAYLTFSKSLCEMKTVKLSIDEKGNTVPDEEKGRPVNCALSWKDQGAFEELLVNALIGPKK